MAPPEDGNPYERQRQELIARNRARLQALGVGLAATALNTAAAKPKQKRKPKAKVPQEPSRHSSRLRADAADDFDETAGASDLALCMINGQCPRCGKVLDGQHKRHLEGCNGNKKGKQFKGRGQVEIEGLDEMEAEEEARLAGAEEKEETEARPAKRSKTTKSQAEKLAELEMSGLVDFTSDVARFVVIGSTGTHYEVELKDPAPSCQCVDFRIRRRMCKHQKLVLTQLGIPDKPQDWHQAVSAKFDEEAQAHKPDADADIESDSDTNNEPDHKAGIKKDLDTNSQPDHGPDPDVKADPDAHDKATKTSALSWPKRPARKR